MNVWRFLSTLIVLSVVFLHLSCSPGEKGSVVYVATDGSDGNTGAKESPVATLTKARDILRAGPAGEAKTIVIRGGKYYDVRLELTPEDSGLTVRAEEGEDVVLYGGRRVTGWEKDGENFYAAPLPGVKEGTWDFRALVVNDGYRLRARYPESGSFTHLNEFRVRWMSSTGGGWERKPTEEELTTMKYKKGDLGPWLEVKNAELTVYHQWDESLVGLKSLDDKAQTVRFSNPSGHPPGAFYGTPKAKTYVVWNVREGMTHPGQWYLDRAQGRLVYWPLPGENIASAEIVAPTTESIIRLEKGTRDVTVENLSISSTTTPLLSGGFGAFRFDGAITGENIANCRFANLAVRNVGGWGFKMDGANIRIEGCEVTGTGAGGIVCRGSGCVITNNHVYKIGVTYPSSIAVNTNGRELPGNEISHNEIHDTPYTAVNCGGNGHVVQYNLIYDTMRELYDGGGIYIGFGKGMVLRGNIIRGDNNTEFKRHAYYMDERADSCIVEYNLALNTNWPSQNHMTINCIIRNNVFIDTGTQLITLPRSSGMTFEKNILIAEKITFQMPVGREVDREVPDILKPFMKADGITSMSNNVMFSRTDSVMLGKLLDYRVFEEAPLEPRDGSVFADPLFIDTAGGNYGFQAGSPALKLGIEPIDVGGAGLGKK